MTLTDTPPTSKTGDWLVGTVREVTVATPGGRVLHIDVPGWPGNLAGQHLDLRLTAEDGYQAVRSYSIASVGDGEVVELAVDQIPDGEVSPYLTIDVMPGDQLEVRGPLGGWFVWRPEQTEPVQLIAGGSGIVPLVAMLRAHAAAASAAPFRLLGSVRTWHDAFYYDEVNGLADDHTAITWRYTRKGPSGWEGPIGRIDRDSLSDAVFAPHEQPSVFVCGPTAFVEHVASLLVELGHDPARIKTERFGG